MQCTDPGTARTASTAVFRRKVATKSPWQGGTGLKIEAPMVLANFNDQRHSFLQMT